MKKAEGYIEEVVNWDCPYVNCREANTEEAYYDSGDVRQCYKCLRSVKVIIA